MPYGLNRLADAQKAGYIVMVEGESDSWTLAHHGFPVLGIPGAEMAKILNDGHLLNIPKIFILQEADAGSSAFVGDVSWRLRNTKLATHTHRSVIRLSV